MISTFRYAPDLASGFPSLRALTLFVDGLSSTADVRDSVQANLGSARTLLQQHGSESQIEAVQHWRAAYRETHTDPTKFRMAAESILRRLRTSDEFTTSLHPLVVLCNSFSARFGVPVAALDCARIEGALTVGFASGDSVYQGFDGSRLVLPAGEVTFEDSRGNAHARKWSHKQSGLSAMSERTTHAFIIAEALHTHAEHDLAALHDAIAQSIGRHWPCSRTTGRLLTGAELTAGVRCPFPEATLVATSSTS